MCIYNTAHQQCPPTNHITAISSSPSNPPAPAMDVLDLTVLHTANFTETLPFADGVFGLVTASLSIHNAQREGGVFAVKEMARVCAPGGRVVVVDLYRYFKQHRTALEECSMRDVRVSLLGFGMMYGILPCQSLTATKPR